MPKYLSLNILKVMKVDFSSPSFRDFCPLSLGLLLWACVSTQDSTVGGKAVRRQMLTFTKQNQIERKRIRMWNGPFH